MEILLKKGLAGLLPADSESEATLKRIKHDTVLRVEMKKVRNPRFHRKFFALLNVAFEAWQPEVKTYKGEVATKNFDRFRKDLIVLAGFYETSYKITGELVLTAKSISFGNMDEFEFQDLYDRVLDVILERVLTNYTKDDVNSVVNEIVGFA